MKYPNLDKEKVLAIDIETHDPNIRDLGPGPRRDGYIIGVSIATQNKSWYFPIKHPDSENVNEEKFFSWLRTLKDKDFIGANLLYDFDYLQYYDFVPNGKLLDVQIAEPLIDENRKYYNLNSLGLKYFGEKKRETEIEEYCKKNKWKGAPQNHLWKMPSRIVAPYAKVDTELAFKVFKKQYQALVDQELIEVFKVETDLLKVLLLMRKIGVRVNVKKLNKTKEKYKNEIIELQNYLNESVGFELNVNAAHSIQKAFDKFDYVYLYTDKGNPCFDAEFLKNHKSDLSNKILKLRHLLKMDNTFLTGLSRFVVNDRIHCQFNSLRGDKYGTVSGRLSSSNPNLQQQPSKGEPKKDVRSLFLPEENCIWVRGDYSQIELRGLAHYATGLKSDVMRQMYINNPNIDIHQTFADIIGIKRSYSKRITFGLIYAMGINKLCVSLGLEYTKGKHILDQYNKKMPFLKTTQKLIEQVARKRGYIKTILKRRRRFNDPRFCYRAINGLIQGTCADILKKAIVDTHKAGIFDILKPHLTVHDELDVSKPKTKIGDEAVKEMKNIFENAIKLKVPIIFDITKGKNWGET